MTSEASDVAAVVARLGAWREDCEEYDAGKWLAGRGSGGSLRGPTGEAMKGTCAVIVGLMLAGVAVGAGAEDLAGALSVREWRWQMGQAGGYPAVTFASGVVAMSNAMGIRCENPPSVGELAAYLLHTADPAAWVNTEILKFFVNHQCRMQAP